MTKPQQRLIDEIGRHIRTRGDAEYWPVVNDWVNDAGPAKVLTKKSS